jgi:hypothetical protein
MARKVIKYKESRSNNNLNYNEWIDLNLKLICENNGGKIDFIGKTEGLTGKRKYEDAKQTLEHENLAMITVMNSTLLPLGEEVCKVGGWINYLESIREANKTKTKPTINIKQIITWIGWTIMVAAAIFAIIEFLF